MRLLRCAIALVSFMAFDSIQVRFRDVRDFKSPFADTRVVPFVGSYLEILRSIVDDVTTEYFWFFANFMDLKTIDTDYIPEQHESKQIHVWYKIGRASCRERV